MNKIFKVIWNKTTQRLEVVSELAKGAVKSSSNSVVNLAKDLSKPVLKLSLLSICLGYPTWAMAVANTDDGRFGLNNNGSLYLDKNNGKYILGVYDAETGSFGFGKAQVGKKGEVFQNGKMIKPAAVGNFQLAIGHDTLIASGYKGIAIGSNYDSSASDRRRQYYFSPLDGRQGGTQGAYAVSLGSGAQAIGRHTLALGANSGNGGAYNGYDDAVFLGSLSRIKSVGQGRENDNINVNNLETKYTDAVKEYNNSQTQDALNKVIEAGRNINNAALNKVEGMTIKSNVVHPTQTGKFTTQDQQVSQINGSCGTTTVSILSVGGKDGNNTMYRQIQNVAAGRIASDSNDAVTGSQLYYVRNYTGWNIGHYDDVTRANTTTGRVNNDHTVIFKPGNYTDVWTSLDSTNRSTVNIEVKTANLGTEVANGKISKIIVTDPIGTDANNTVARTAGVKSVLDKFNEIKADKVDITGYSHVNANNSDRNVALVKADGSLATFNYEGRNNSSITKDSAGATKDNNGKYAEASGAQADRSIASGVYANALAKDSIAIGTGANVNNYWGTQFKESLNGIAIGKLAQVEGSAGAIAFGAGSTILRNEPYNVGSENAIAIGNGSKITAANGAIAIGNNTNITAVSSGTGNGAVNAVAIGNNATVERENSIALGNGSKASRENTVAIGTNVNATRENSVVIGQNATATQERVVAIGAYATVNGDRAVAIGPEATANGSKSIVIGGIGDAKAKAIAEKEQAIVIGNGAQATDNATYSITLGNNAKTAGATGISIGDRAQVVASAANGIALGQSAVANNSGDIAIGQSSSTSTKHTVSDIKIGDTTLSKGVAATDNGTVSFGKDNVKRQIQNVGAGEISATSSDVITGSQLYHVIKAADEIAKTEYNFQVNGKNIKTMRNNGTSTANNAHNTLDFKAGDGLDVTYENNAVTYKLNADSKQAITDAKTAAQTVTTKLNEIDQSVQRAETAATSATTAATNAASSATVASTAAKVAISSASAANSSATAASTSASAANSSATAASTSASAANSSATAASTSASAANSSATAASTSASAANSSATAASTSASAANSSATAASSSASAANSSATAASSSASAANSSATAASSSASAANSSATAASSSASAANSSATAASSSASAANSSATAASSSASAANSSATAASSSASAANSSATAASSSASAANSSATAASSSASAANSSATAASSSASAANSSATAASSSASAANSSATAASSSASAANSSATAASSSASAASSSASAANSSATAASSAASAAQSSAQRIEDSGLISKDGKTAFAADNTSNRDSAKAKGKDATAAGYGSNASGKNATAIGNNATASGRNSTALGQNATATAENSVAIGQDSVANERNTVSVGRVGNERRITNVADPVNNTDAANKRYVDNAVGSVRNDLRKTEKKLRGGVAGATAMANIPQVTQPGKLMVGAGIGNYKGQSAVAVGLSKSSDNNRVIFKMSGSATTQGDYNIGAGIGYQW